MTQRLLSPREQEIMKYACEGMTCKKIGETLGISYHTVRSHFRSIYRTLDVTNRSAAVAIFIRGNSITR